jgi:predicted transcriptional regulator of viral defense system
MVSSAPKQNEIITLLLQQNKPMSLREITNKSELTYHQVASVIVALKSKGYVKRIYTGLYEATDDAKLLELSPEIQIKILKQKVEVLEQQVKSLLIQLSNK